MKANTVSIDRGLAGVLRARRWTLIGHAAGMMALSSFLQGYEEGRQNMTLTDLTVGLPGTVGHFLCLFIVLVQYYRYLLVLRGKVVHCH